MSLSRKVRQFLAKKTAGNTASFWFSIDLALQGNSGGSKIRYDSDNGIYFIGFLDGRRPARKCTRKRFGKRTAKSLSTKSAAVETTVL